MVRCVLCFIKSWAYILVAAFRPFACVVLLCNLCTYVIVSRSVSDRVAFGVRSDCVRRPIRLRSVSNRITFGAR